MKLFLAYTDDEDYEYITDCMQFLVIAENETRALEIAKEEMDLEELKVFCICENMNQEYRSKYFTYLMCDEFNKESESV